MFPILRRFDWSEIKSWDALEKAIGGLPTQQDRGEAFEEFSAALLEIHKDYYQATKIWRFCNVPDEILERLGCSNWTSQAFADTVKPVLTRLQTPLD